MKETFAGIFATVFMLSLFAARGYTAHFSSNPCEFCGDTPTKGYKNTYSNEKEYYCKDCSSECHICGDDATTHYTGGFGTIIFACDDCYEYIESLD